MQLPPELLRSLNQPYAALNTQPQPQAPGQPPVGLLHSVVIAKQQLDQQLGNDSGKNTIQKMAANLPPNSLQALSSQLEQASGAPAGSVTPDTLATADKYLEHSQDKVDLMGQQLNERHKMNQDTRDELEKLKGGIDMNGQEGLGLAIAGLLPLVIGSAAGHPMLGMAAGVSSAGSMLKSQQEDINKRQEQLTNNLSSGQTEEAKLASVVQQQRDSAGGAPILGANNEPRIALGGRITIPADQKLSDSQRGELINMSGNVSYAKTLIRQIQIGQKSGADTTTQEQLLKSTLGQIYPKEQFQDSGGKFTILGMSPFGGGKEIDIKDYNSLYNNIDQKWHDYKKSWGVEDIGETAAAKRLKTANIPYQRVSGGWLIPQPNGQAMFTSDDEMNSIISPKK